MIGPGPSSREVARRFLAERLARLGSWLRDRWPWRRAAPAAYFRPEARMVATCAHCDHHYDIGELRIPYGRRTVSIVCQGCKGQIDLSRSPEGEVTIEQIT